LYSRIQATVEIAITGSIVVSVHARQKIGRVGAGEAARAPSSSGIAQAPN
jgi:hypothetical protein